MKNVEHLAFNTVIFFIAAVLGSCGSTSSSSSFDAGRPSTIITVVKSAVSKVGTGVTPNAIHKLHSLSIGFTSSMCDTHGDPKSGGSQMAQTDTAYPGTLTYCKTSVNDGSPDTVAGAFEMPRGISCAVEKAGIVFDGSAHTLSVPLDTDCFTAEQISDIGVTSFTATVTGSKPASFNSYFDAGIRIQSDEMDVDYQLGTKVSGSLIEFTSVEGSGTTRSGAFSGSFNTSTGELRYEGRMDRINCSTSGSCGWNRHIRAYADLTVDSSGNPVSLESISFGYSNIQAPPGQSGYAGVVVTATGSLSSGIKARAWTATDGSSGAPTSASQYDVAGNWSETTNSFCYTSTSDTASTCGTGLGLFSGNTNFLLNDATHTSTANYLSGYDGMTFTAVDLSSDLP